MHTRLAVKTRMIRIKWLLCCDAYCAEDTMKLEGHLVERITSDKVVPTALSEYNHRKTTRRCSDGRPIHIGGIFPT